MLNKILTVLAVTLLFTGASVLASNNQQNHVKPDFDKLVSLLSLSSERATELKTIMNGHRQVMRANRAEFKQQHKQTLKTVLNDKEFEILKLYMKQFKKHKKHKKS